MEVRDRLVMHLNNPYNPPNLLTYLRYLGRVGHGYIKSKKPPIFHHPSDRGQGRGATVQIVKPTNRFS